MSTRGPAVHAIMTTTMAHLASRSGMHLQYDPYAPAVFSSIYPILHDLFDFRPAPLFLFFGHAFHSSTSTLPLSPRICIAHHTRPASFFIEEFNRITYV
ncbi:hypothetical protein EVG20_g5312 [Dentipellis fragilis]|uniref:Uncharacterized protein n=1 Tax=Dentipellis fragilis TaxID=205917 RepID=A0A4Y9YVL9_9AGAM|nr:hypothetical protein EVG20_g5312 [Dentipellis fragilis]